MAAVVYLVDDLLFTSKIRETARQLGFEVAAARSLDAVGAATQGARYFIVDLRRPDALAALAAASPEAQAIGFVDHEAVERMEAARARGCIALPKGKFASELARLLSTPG